MICIATKMGVRSRKKRANQKLTIMNEERRNERAWFTMRNREGEGAHRSMPRDLNDPPHDSKPSLSQVRIDNLADLHSARSGYSSESSHHLRPHCLDHFSAPFRRWEWGCTFCGDTNVLDMIEIARPQCNTHIVVTYTWKLEGSVESILLVVVVHVGQDMLMAASCSGLRRSNLGRRTLSLGLSLSLRRKLMALRSLRGVTVSRFLRRE